MWYVHDHTLAIHSASVTWIVEPLMIETLQSIITLNNLMFQKQAKGANVFKYSSSLTTSPIEIRERHKSKSII